jgi:hypothetical protein
VKAWPYAARDTPSRDGAPRHRGRLRPACARARRRSPGRAARVRWRARDRPPCRTTAAHAPNAGTERWLPCGCLAVRSARPTLVHLGSAQVFPDHARDGALQASNDFSGGLALGLAALDVFAGGWVEAHACEGDHVQPAVDLAVAAAVQAVPHGPSWGRGNGRRSRQPGEVRVGRSGSARRRRRGRSAWPRSGCRCPFRRLGAGCARRQGGRARARGR